MKSGWKTSEFWTVVVANLITIVSGAKGLIPDQTGVIVVASLTAVYTILRSMVKMKNIPAVNITGIDQNATTIQPEATK